MHYKHFLKFSLVFTFYIFLSQSCKKKSQILDPLTNNNISQSEAQGLELVTQDDLKKLFNEGIKHQTYDVQTKSWVVGFKLKDGSVIAVREYKGIYAISTGYGTKDHLIHVFDRDLPQEALGKTLEGKPTPKSFVGPALLTQIHELFDESNFADKTLHSRVGIVFDEVPTEKNPVTTTFDIYITRSDLAALDAYHKSGKPLPDEVMIKINKLNQLLAKNPDLFVRMIGHGSIGLQTMQGDDLVSRPLSYYPEQLRRMLSSDLEIRRIHLDFDSCLAGACAADGGKSMLGTSLEELRKQFPHTILQGVASPSYVNYSADPKVKVMWMPQLKNGVWNLIPVDLRTVVGGYVEGKLDSAGKVQYSVIGVDEQHIKSSSPALKALVDARASIIAKMPQVEKGPSDIIPSTKFKTASVLDVKIARQGQQVSPEAQIFAQLEAVEEMFQGLIDGRIPESEALKLGDQLKSWKTGNPIIEKPIQVASVRLPSPVRAQESARARTPAQSPQRRLSPVPTEPTLTDSPSSAPGSSPGPASSREGSPVEVIERTQRFKSPTSAAVLEKPYVQTNKITLQPQPSGKISIGIGVAITAAYAASASLGMQVILSHP